ncbi:MAG: branched-chain amino acid ABC transporter permease [Streptosporangiaceae bacterium]|nr:branched-chain amino acid ABC transporter permease [Streptosporangiaceae bacterium]
MSRHLGAAALVAILVALLSIRLTQFRDFQMAQVAVYVTAVAGLTVLTGLSGQISLGNGAFMAIGGYGTALLLLHLAWPLAAVLAASAAIAALAGALVGAATARLHGPYLAGATLLLAVALPSLTYKYPGVFGGEQGLNVTVSAPGSVPLTRWQAWITCGCALLTLVLLANLSASRIGRNWRAVRDDEVAAALAGVNVAWARILAFVVSAACAGLAGSLLAVTTGLVAPTDFTVTLSVALLTGAVIGGLGSLAGAVWGSLLVVLVPTYATDVATSHGLSSAVGSNIPVAAYGVVLIVVMLVFPNGIQGGLRRLAARVVPSPRRDEPVPAEMNNTAVRNASREASHEEIPKTPARRRARGRIGGGGRRLRLLEHERQQQLGRADGLGAGDHQQRDPDR